jgi:transcriptional regulator NrdR family protein
LDRRLGNLGLLSSIRRRRAAAGGVRQRIHDRLRKCATESRRSCTLSSVNVVTLDVVTQISADGYFNTGRIVAGWTAAQDMGAVGV